MISIEDVDALIARGGPYAPRWGWHDNHRTADGTSDYLPALMQVRAEFGALLGAVNAMPASIGALQLGMGNCEASHGVWSAIFSRTATIDFGVVAEGTNRFPGMDTHDRRALDFATANAPYDLLFIDAGHSFDDVARDHADYAALVRPGGIVAFHDALPRSSYPEVEVWRYLRDRLPQARIVGDEVGTAWYVKR